MTRVRFALLLAGAMLAFAACSLNPQPFPPQSSDYGGTSADASTDSAVMHGDGGFDVNVAPPDSGFADAGKDSGAIDAAPDAESDATTDADDDAQGDASAD